MDVWSKYEGFAKPRSTPQKIYFHFVNIIIALATDNHDKSLLSATEHFANADEWGLCVILFNLKLVSKGILGSKGVSKELRF